MANPQRSGLRILLADRRISLILVAILAAILVANLGTGMIIPVLPIYAKSFGVSYGAIGLLISSFAIARLITDLACRPLVERLGQLRSVTLGVAVVSVSSVCRPWAMR